MTEGENRWPCAQCGADLRFVPGSTLLECDHCGHVQPIPEGAAAGAAPLAEIDLSRGLKDDIPAAHMEEVRVTPCPSCGAQVEFRGATHSAECPFCAAPVVIGTGEERRIKPQGVLPFTLTEEAARDAVGDWLGRLWFAPNGLQQFARKGRAMTGIYVPYWSFDASTRSRYRGQRGDHYYETRTVMRNGRSQTEQVRRTRWTRVSGSVARRFDDLLVMASEGLPRRYTDSLQPWNLQELHPYRPDFLAGFAAEAYTVNLHDGHQLARDSMAETIRADVRSDIGGDEQQIDSVDTDWSDETFKHVLLPLWLAVYRYNGKPYRVVVNGQTGMVAGERPWSVWKIAFAILLGLIALAIGAYFANLR